METLSFLLNMCFFDPDTGHYEDTKKFFDTAAEQNNGFYDYRGRKKYSPWVMMNRKNAAEMLKRYCSNIHSVVECGCGRADFSDDLKTLFEESFYYGIDLSFKTLQIAGKYRNNLLNSNINNIPLKSGSNDLCVCMNTLHHILPADRRQVMGELCRITGKYMLLEIKNSEDFYTRYLKEKKITGRISVYPMSVAEIKALTPGFKIIARKNIFGVSCISPNIVLLLEKL